MISIRRPRLLLLLALLPLAPMSAFADGGTADVAVMPEHLIVRDTKVGTGPEAQDGSMIDVQYTGWIYDARAKDLHGKQFDSSVGRGPFSFMLGVGSVIPGWDRGLVGLKVGGKRTLIIPPNIAYGQRGAGQDIPPGSTLIFDIELLKVE
jgi:FKBP-type peptidyl-prolyl cis-trans isomerase FkpA